MNVKLPDLNDARFLGDSIGGKDLLYTGLVVSVLGIVVRRDRLRAGQESAGSQVDAATSPS